MSVRNEKHNQPRVIERDNLQALFDALTRHGYQLLGPTLQGNGVVYDEIHGVDDLPVGMIDHQDGGTYRMERTTEPTCFGYVVGSQSWKKYLHVPTATLWKATSDGRGFSVQEPSEKPSKRALIGVRACELAAIGIHDRVLLNGPHSDVLYQRTRENLFILAVNCTRAGGTCFCTSMGTGPKATRGFDLALTEVINGARHYFVVEVGSKAGSKLIEHLPTVNASENDQDQAAAAVDRAARNMGRQVNTKGLKERLNHVVEHPHWAEIAERCLTCGNCTMVCPTCFCTTIEDWTELGGASAERVRRWDSCFTVEFSYIYGGSIRPSPAARYRQWMTHKLASWVDQFGTFGCVGCGRCITWCPVGIDITEEARVFEHSLQPAVAQT